MTDAADDDELTFEDPASPVSLAAHYAARIEEQDRTAAAEIGVQIAERFSSGVRTYCGQPLFAGLGVAGPTATAASITRFAFGNMSEPAMLLIAAPAIDRVIAALFGASDADTSETALDRSRLTALDRYIVGRLVALFESALADVARARAGLTFQRLDEAGEPRPPSRRLISQSVSIAWSAAPGDTGDIQLLLPRPLAARLLNASVVRPPVDPIAWRTRLRAALADIELPIHCIVGEPEIGINRMLALRVGDTLAIDQAGVIRLDIAGRPVATVYPGEQNGRRAIRIDAFHGDAHPQLPSAGVSR
jgi:flagellar motor switch protein FliM